ncbi:hypothetical protein FACS189498_1970 [Spirochaetia bacterium]|nr:hypothetical protein FACS189498_1970 [Spirochaetia bacterium]
MLHRECASSELLNILADLQKKHSLGHFSLGEGTALALHLGHRKSDDIDLFTLRPILKERLKGFLDKTYGDKIRYTSEGDDSDFIHSYFGGIKVDFLSYRQVYIEEPKVVEGIKLLGIKDIGALKLRAISNHRNKAKDFADVYFILKDNSLEDMFGWYRKKYSKNDICDVKKSLLSFDRIGNDEWEGIKYLNYVSKEMIMNVISENISLYNRSNENKVDITKMDNEEE